MKILALVVSLSAALVLTGCAVKTSADHLNASTAKASVLEQAGEYCVSQGKELLVTKTLKRQKVKYFYDVTFLCLDEGDPRLVSPEYETTVEPR